MKTTTIGAIDYSFFEDYLKCQKGLRPATVRSSQRGRALTRYGIYKMVRRHARGSIAAHREHHIFPLVLRHTAAVHLLESGVDVNVIRAWLGHVNLETTNRYAEITTRMKEAALRHCEPPVACATQSSRSQAWKDDKVLLAWLESL